MHLRKDLPSMIEATEQLDSSQIIDYLLPKKDGSYTIQDIESRLALVHDQIEEVEHECNNQFETNLDPKTLTQLQNLYRNLHDTQLDVMKLQCDITFTREQYDSVISVCDNPSIKERREIVKKEAILRESLQRMKYSPVLEFFDRFADHLALVADNCQKSSLSLASNYLQVFDWTYYHQAIFSLRACGRAMIEISQFERIYLSNIDISEISFKQPISEIDFNNFIQFHDTYSLDSQLIIGRRSNQRQSFREFKSDPIIESLAKLKEPETCVVFQPLVTKLRSTTIKWCKILVDINMNYIEAHLTDGINIDKLNGGENAGLMLQEEQQLPLYAFSPQDYITQIGQHLLTLRKQTEQFDGNDVGPLKFALESLEQSQEISIDVRSYKSVTEIIMRCIVRHCIRSLLARTNNSILSRLTVNGRRQLATDALYLDNVLEDLGLLDASEPNVEKFKSLLVQ